MISGGKHTADWNDRGAVGGASRSDKLVRELLQLAR